MEFGVRITFQFQFERRGAGGIPLGSVPEAGARRFVVLPAFTCLHRLRLGCRTPNRPDIQFG